MNRRKSTIIWLAVALAALGFVIWKTPAAEFHQAISRTRWSWAGMGIMIFFTSQTLLAVRWVLLLRVQGVSVAVFQAVKLTYLGLFYNNFMPGAVGGDLIKGWYITHHSGPDRRVAAAVTVFVDRLTGLVGMILVGAIASLLIGPKLLPIGPWKIQIRFLIWALLLIMVVSFAIFFSRRLRRFLLPQSLLARLPFAGTLRKIDGAIRINKQHPLAVITALALTVTIQSLSVVAVWVLTQSLDMEGVTFLQCLIILPIIWLFSAAIPVPGGLGIMENLFIPFFAEAVAAHVGLEAGRGQAAALALLNRLMLYACSVPGALVPIFGGHLPKVRELAHERELEESQLSAGTAENGTEEKEL